MTVTDGTIKSATPAGHEIVTSRRTFYCAAAQRGVPIEIGRGIQFIFQHKRWNLESLIRTTEPGVGMEVICQFLPTTPHEELDAWCTKDERVVLSRDITAVGQWDFGTETSLVNSPSQAHIWVALIRHLMIRRRIQSPTVAKTVMEQAMNSVGHTFTVSTDERHSREVDLQGLISWLLEACRPAPNVATAWQQAVARM